MIPFSIAGSARHGYRSLISEVPHSKQCQRVQSACNIRIQSNLRHELRHFLNKADTERTALHLGLLIDGIWESNGSLTMPVNSETTISEMEYAITKMLPNDADSIVKHNEARQKIENIARIALAFQPEITTVI
ncbi:MAG: hypothetical protein OXG56_07645 [Gammaproteobacteria bacterium]|nr:hypothetical protein [Gammaproteobacteria bacterium]